MSYVDELKLSVSISDSVSATPEPRALRLDGGLVWAAGAAVLSARATHHKRARLTAGGSVLSKIFFPFRMKRLRNHFLFVLLFLVAKPSPLGFRPQIPARRG